MPQETPKLIDFQSIRLKLASPEEILSWSYGEVTKPETINYRTQKPEKDGLFCERIFGPSKDWECYCGKYHRIRYRGVVCDKCGVEVTRASVRRERMGHIKLATPVCNIRFLRGGESKIGIILNLPVNELEKVIYYAAYIITKVDEAVKKESFEEIDREYRLKLKTQQESRDSLKQIRDQAVHELQEIKKYRVLGENEYYALSRKYGEIFEAEIGSEAVHRLLEEIDLKSLEGELIKAAEKESSIQRKKVLKRLKLVRGFLAAGIRPEWMFITILPVLPPDLRPMVPLDGDRYISSDLNDLYRQVINRNNRLKKLQELKAPEVIIRNDKRMLQRGVDALIDNSIRRGQGQVFSATAQKRPLYSLADMLRGPYGLIRNLLGKKVDYSGYSVITSGPELRLDECGLPKKMALEFFKLFIINKLVEREIVHNIRAADQLIKEAPPIIWALLEEAIQDRYVLLSRMPAFSRASIQAFRPVLIEGSAIRLNPLACATFNVDFDGDGMAVHLPLTEEAQTEARKIMLSAGNLLNPATGDPFVLCSDDIVLGCYFLSWIVRGLKGEGKAFGSSDEALLAYQCGEIDLRAKIKVRLPRMDIFPHATEKALTPLEREKFQTAGQAAKLIETCAGLLIFNEALPPEVPFQNRLLTKKVLSEIVADVIDRCGPVKARGVFDAIKKLGFEYSAVSGISWGMDDLRVPEEKPRILREAEDLVSEIAKQYDEGLLTDDERKDRVVEVWQQAADRIGKLVPLSLDKEGALYPMLESKAVMTRIQLMQMAGMKGLVSNPAGEIIELPVKNSYKEGLNTLQYFISANNNDRDTALKYYIKARNLERRLLHAAQDLIISEEDCGDKQGIEVWRRDGTGFGLSFAARLLSRPTVEDVIDPATGMVLARKGEIIDKKTGRFIEREERIEKVSVRSPMTCRSLQGVCQSCYGYDLGNNHIIRIGEAAGVVAAQAVGLAVIRMATKIFHRGETMGDNDIPRYFHRIDEIFEIREVEDKAVISEIQGIVENISDKGKQQIIRIRELSDIMYSRKPSASADRYVEYTIPQNSAVWVEEGQKILAGTQLCQGDTDINDLFRVSGARATERYIINELQNVFASQGLHVHDKHLEMITRQMFSRVHVRESGGSQLVPGEIMERNRFIEINNDLLAYKKTPAKAAQLIMGITPVVLSSASFLRAASFWHPLKTLFNAACAGKEDKLLGLTENIIIGRLIPAGTGYRSNLMRASKIAGKEIDGITEELSLEDF